ncbi:MAG: hypothetical protein ABIY63_04610 [Fibrobacteria bacterium]
MSTENIRKACVFLFLSGIPLLLSVGSVRGNSGPLPASSTSSSILEDSIPRLGRIAHSPEQLLRNAIARLNARDTLGLMLMGPDPEQLIAIYKKTPEGKNAGEAQLNFAREFYYLDNGKLLYRSLAKYGGKHLALVSWKPTAPPVILDGGGEILRNIDIVVKDQKSGSGQTVAFVQSIYVDKDGCKIWGYQDSKAGKGVKD